MVGMAAASSGRAGLQGKQAARQGWWGLASDRRLSQGEGLAAELAASAALQPSQSPYSHTLGKQPRPTTCLRLQVLKQVEEGGEDAALPSAEELVVTVGGHSQRLFQLVVHPPAAPGGPCMTPRAYYPTDVMGSLRAQSPPSAEMCTPSFSNIHHLRRAPVEVAHLQGLAISCHKRLHEPAEQHSSQQWAQRTAGSRGR